jgi:predicted nucleic acid-binding protein
MALRELVARHRRLGVLDLRGKVRWEGNLEESAAAVIVLDTSVGIDVPERHANGSSGAVRPADRAWRAVALTDVMLTEILQGLRSHEEARLVERQLRALPILRLDSLVSCWPPSCTARPGGRRDDPQDARLPHRCSLRSNGAPLLHTDADFDRLAECTALRLYPCPSDEQ